MRTEKANNTIQSSITDEFLSEWQNILNETAVIFGVSAGLITRVNESEIEILLTSSTPGNPYPQGYTSEYPNSNWYCEHTLKSKSLNLIPNALEEELWKENPAAIDLHMISYAGMPIIRPDGKPFGTVCFIDNKKNSHNQLHIKFIEQIKRMVELSLKVIDYREEISSCDSLLNDLSKIYPICSYCKKVKTESNDWISVETYVHEITGALPSHSICPECYQREMGKI